MEFVVAYRCSVHVPLKEVTVHCPAGSCGVAVACSVPASAYAFVTRGVKTD